MFLSKPFNLLRPVSLGGHVFSQVQHEVCDIHGRAACTTGYALLINCACLHGKNLKKLLQATQDSSQSSQTECSRFEPTIGSNTSRSLSLEDMATEELSCAGVV